MTLYLIGLGLGTRGYLTFKAVEAADHVDELFLDTYTGWIHRDLLTYLEKRFGDRLIKADRKMLEEDMERIVLRARGKDVGILVPGDPLIATTHISLILEAERMGVDHRIVYGVSVISASASASGLQAYKFGRITTIPKNGVGVESCYRVIAENLEKGLHSLILLDTAGDGLKIPEALRILMRAEEEFGRGIFVEERPVIVLTRLGSNDEYKWAGKISEALRKSYPPPPHLLIVPGELHFMEAEALKRILRADEGLIDSYRPIRYERDRIGSYISKVEKVLKLVKEEAEKKSGEIIRVVESYLEDSKRFLELNDSFDALAAISYVEGLLDSLRMMGFIEFEWPKT